MLRKYWTAIKAWLFSGPASTQTHFGNPDLYPIDTEQLAKELGVEEQAEQLGRREIPASDARELTGIEAKIVQVIEKARQDYLDWANDRLRVLNQQINAMDVAPIARRARQLDAEFERTASNHIDTWAAELARLAEGRANRQEDFERFLADNRLRRPPKYPTAGQKAVRYSILAALIVGEGGLNAAFFAQGVWGGFLEGFFYAVIFAFLNIALAWGYGRHLLPQAIHVKPLRKALGIVGIPLSFAAILAMALIIAHFRDAATSGNLASAAQIALLKLRLSPTDLKDIYSLVLAVLSIGFAVIAMVDSYGLDDRYPGYGDVHRALISAVDDSDHEMHSVREQISMHKDEALADLDRLLDRMLLNLKSLDENILSKEKVERRLHTSWANVDNCLDALIAKFRTSNRVHRTTPAPMYFSRRPVLRELMRPAFNLAADKKKYDEQRNIVRKVETEVSQLRANIQASFSRQFDRLVPIDEQVRARAA